MRIITIPSHDIDSPSRQIADYIKGSLAKNKAVLWMISGGSAIKVAVLARQYIGALSERDKLHVALIDERYGEMNHQDSNSRQLVESGFDVSGLELHPVLIGQNLGTTSRRYNDMLDGLLHDVDVSIGLLGMGADGHTAGLLPANPLMETMEYVGFFDGFDFQRITTTPAFLRLIDEVVLYAAGESKWQVIGQLETTQLPVGCLRESKNLTVYTDYKGDKA